MNLILWLIVGGLIGWIASRIMHTDAQQNIFLNIVVGIVGALLAGFLLSPLFGIGTINQNNFSLPALLISLLGSIVLLAIINLLRRGTVRLRPILNLPGAEVLARRLPFTRVGRIVAGQYDPVRQLPGEDKQVLRIDTLLVGNHCARRSATQALLTVVSTVFPDFVRYNHDRNLSSI